MEAFLLKRGFPDNLMNIDNKSIGVLSSTRPGKYFILHSRKGTLAHFVPFCPTGSIFHTAAEFANARKYSAKNAEKGSVEAPRRIPLSTPIVLLSLFSGQSGEPMFASSGKAVQ